jgi:hypothetical protein
MIDVYRVPTIIDYVNLKSKQMQLHRQEHILLRQIEIARRELHLRRSQWQHHPETIIHPWKSLGNPSSMLFRRQCQTWTNRTDDIQE